MTDTIKKLLSTSTCAALLVAMPGPQCARLFANTFKGPNKSGTPVTPVPGAQTGKIGLGQDVQPISLDGTQPLTDDLSPLVQDKGIELGPALSNGKAAAGSEASADEKRESARSEGLSGPGWPETSAATSQGNPGSAKTTVGRLESEFRPLAPGQHSGYLDKVYSNSKPQGGSDEAPAVSGASGATPDQTRLQAASQSAGAVAQPAVPQPASTAQAGSSRRFKPITLKEALFFALSVGAITAGAAVLGLPVMDMVRLMAIPLVVLYLKRNAFHNFNQFTRSEKAYILGQATFLFALSIYLVSLPLLVQTITGEAAMTGVARAVHYWTFAGSTLLFSSEVVKRTRIGRVLIGSALIRAALFGTIGIGVLILGAGMPWNLTLLIIGLNSVVVSVNHLADIDAAGAQKVFSDNDKIEQAGYSYAAIRNGMMLVVPWLMGRLMDVVEISMGAGAGVGIGFTAFMVILGCAAFIYRYVQVPKEREVLEPWFKGDLFKGIRGLFEIPPRSPRVLISAGFAAAAAAGYLVLPGVFGIGAGIALGAVAFAVFKEWETISIIMGNPAILWRWITATAEYFVEDSLFMVVIPSVAVDMLKAGFEANGYVVSLLTAGGLLASGYMSKNAKRIQAEIGTYPFVKRLTILASLAFIPSIGLWYVPSLGLPMPIAVLLVGLLGMAMKVLCQPIQSRMGALLQTEINSDPKARAKSEDIFALMTAAEVSAAGAGAVAFAFLFKNSVEGTWIYDYLGATAPLKMVTLGLVLISAFYVASLSQIKKQLDTQAAEPKKN